MENKNLAKAKNKKNDEFYTQYEDIEKEISAYLMHNPKAFENKTVLCPCDDPEWSNFTKYFVRNFETLKLKKLISTSHGYQDGERGKCFVLSAGDIISSKVDIEQVGWKYLDGDGDFRSDEIKAFREEADIIVTNPPFSIYKEFVPWLVESKKQFLVIANKNSITYKEVFPLIMHGKMWSGNRAWSGGMWFVTNNLDDVDKVVNGVKLKNVSSVWFTNMEHGRRHEPLELMTMADNIKHSKHKKVRENGYQKYDNYDAIEVPYTDAIPIDYSGVMGVPISFLEKYCPEQFEIIGATESEGKGFSNGLWDKSSGIAQPLLNGNRVYKRFFIRTKC